MLYLYIFQDKGLQIQKLCVPLHSQTSRGGAVVARWAHNPKVVGSSPAPATKQTKQQMQFRFFISFY